MRIFSFGFLLLLDFVVCTWSYAQDTIHWRPDCKLRWEDYQGNADTTSEFGAVSSCRISLKTNISQDSLLFNVCCFFEKNKSWKQNGVSSTSLLKHEQGHFDITEYFARKLRWELKKYKPQDATLQEDVKRTFKQIWIEKEKMDALYDAETAFSTNQQTQALWSEKIRTLLSSLSGFSK